MVSVEPGLGARSFARSHRTDPRGIHKMARGEDFLLLREEVCVCVVCIY